jgi:alpha-beta hydrolase superfamily lysophospholipase
VLYVKTQRGGFDPQPPGHEWPSSRGMRFDSLKIGSGDRVLDAWWIPAEGADSGAVLLFQGNAENVSEWLDAAQLLHGHHLDVMLFDYSGYGRSTGSASVNAVIEDGVSALRVFERRAPRGVARTGAGLSLGAGVLMEATTRYPGALDRVALMEPFSSGRDAAVHLKLLPGWAASLMPDAFDNVRLARSLRVPLLVVHSTGDKKFPVEFARRIADAALAPKRLVVLDGFEHAAARRKPAEAYWAPVVEFAKAK